MASYQKIGSANPGVMVIDSSETCVMINYLSGSKIVINGSAALQNFQFMPAVPPFLIGQEWKVFNNTVNQANFCDFYGNLIGAVQGGRTATITLVGYETVGVGKNFWFESHDTLADQTLLWNLPISTKTNQTLKMNAAMPRNVIIYVNGDDNHSVSTLNFDVYVYLPAPEDIAVGTVYNIQYVFGSGRTGSNTHIYVKASDGSDISNFTTVVNLLTNGVNNVTCTCILPYSAGSYAWIASSKIDAATAGSDFEALWQLLEAVGVLIPGGQIFDAVVDTITGVRALVSFADYVQEITGPSILYSTFKGSANKITYALSNAETQAVVAINAQHQVTALQNAAISNLNPSESKPLTVFTPRDPLFAIVDIANTSSNTVTNAGAKWGENFTTI